MKLQEEENKRAEATPLSTDRQQAPTSGPQRPRVSTVSSSSVGKDKKSLVGILMDSYLLQKLLFNMISNH